MKLFPTLLAFKRSENGAGSQAMNP